jgi:hypothetical protein
MRGFFRVNEIEIIADNKVIEINHQQRLLLLVLTHAFEEVLAPRLPCSSPLVATKRIVYSVGTDFS